jgi:hypothetical protein
MADTKISQLPSATTPLSGAELVPLVQSGATVQTPTNEISKLTAATANIFTAAQTISTGASQALFSFTANAAVAKTIQFLTGANSRWVVSSETTAESGSDAGSNFIINRYNDAGSYLGTPLLVNRATGVSAFEGLAVTSSGGLGYGTGSGGAVTQLTSKATGVTLNKTNGSIVMNAAALGAGATTSFTLTNSTIAATDVVIVNNGGGAADPSQYDLRVKPGAGNLVVWITNRSGGSLSEAYVINFAVIKAVTA